MTLNIFTLVDHPHIMDLVGFIPSFLNEDDPRPAREQFDANYQHGGGWRPMDGWELSERGILIYNAVGHPEEEQDPPLEPVAAIRFRGELVLIYSYGWVCVKQADGSFEVARMD